MGKKKIKPNLPKEHIPNRRFYGSHSDTSSKSYNKKTNYICSHYDCGYSCRQWIWSITKSNKMSVSSTKCPTHGDTLINVGNGATIPKKKY